MNPVVGNLLTAVIVAALSGFVSWRIAQRNTSGRVDTSPADALWKTRETWEATLLADAKALRDEVEDVRAASLDSFTQMLELRRQLAEALEQVEVGRVELHRARNDCAVAQFERDRAVAELAACRGTETGSSGHDG